MMCQGGFTYQNIYSTPDRDADDEEGSAYPQELYLLLSHAVKIRELLKKTVH